MLNPFPELLVFKFFAPTLLRLAVACAFFYFAYAVYARRADAAKMSLPLLGVQPRVMGLAIAVYSAIGLMLLFGYYTQIGALLGALAALKELWWGKRLSPLLPFSRMTAFLLLALCLSLLLTGAGALAYDIPL